MPAAYLLQRVGHSNIGKRLDFPKLHVVTAGINFSLPAGSCATSFVRPVKVPTVDSPRLCRCSKSSPPRTFCRPQKLVVVSLG